MEQETKGPVGISHRAFFGFADWKSIFMGLQGSGKDEKGRLKKERAECRKTEKQQYFVVLTVMKESIILMKTLKVFQMR